MLTFQFLLGSIIAIASAAFISFPLAGLVFGAIIALNAVLTYIKEDVVAAIIRKA
jgi:hypothetical protein